MERNKKKDKKKKGLFAVILIALVVLAACAIYIVHYYKVQKEAREAYEKLREQVEIEQLVEAIEPEEVTEPEVDKAVVEIPVDFEALQEKNPDIYAWINVPGTVIDYPILQSPTDDIYYLNHTVDKVGGLPGSIYTESLNVKDFSDPNTLIYGHNMKDGTMFGGLHAYADNGFFQENPYINIYTPTEVLKYQIFAAYLSDDKHILKSFDFESPEVFQRYLDDVFSLRIMGASFNKELEVSNESKIITLSTCTSVDTQRWLIQAVLIEGE